MKQPQRPPEAREIDQDLLAELEQQSLQEIRKVRRHERLEAKLDLIVSVGNGSDRTTPSIDGYTRDLSAGGCRAILEHAPTVGDVYRVQVKDPKGTYPVMFARCLRCALVRENAFDCGFMFFSSLELGDSASPSMGTDLLD